MREILMKRTARFIIPALFTCLLISTDASSQQPVNEDPFIAVVLKVTSNVQVQSSGRDELTPLKKDDRLYPGDRIVCGEDGYASLIFADNAVELKLYPNSDLTLQGSRTSSSIVKRILLPVGRLLLKVVRGDMEVVTPTSVASVKGTKWWTLVETTGLTKVIVLEGKVEVKHRETGETVLVEAGNTAVCTTTGELEVNPTDGSEIPDQEQEDRGTLDIEFQDGSGENRTIHIEFEK
jgi:hypothetical protein